MGPSDHEDGKRYYFDKTAREHVQWECPRELKASRVATLAPKPSTASSSHRDGASSRARRRRKFRITGTSRPATCDGNVRETTR